MGAITLDLLKREVHREGREVHLQPREFALLEQLMRHAGKVVTRTMFLERIWGFHFDPQTNIVESHLSRLRSKLNDGHVIDPIETLRGIGYRMRGRCVGYSPALHTGVAFTYSCVFALAILALGTSVYFAADAEFRRQHDAGIVEESSLLQREYREGGAPDVSEAIAKREAGQVSNSYRYAFFDDGGRRRAGKLDVVPMSPGIHDLALRDRVGSTVPARALVTVFPNGDRLLIAADLRALKRIDDTILWLFAGAFILVVLVGLAGRAHPGHLFAPTPRAHQRDGDCDHRRRPRPAHPG